MNTSLKEEFLLHLQLHFNKVDVILSIIIIDLVDKNTPNNQVINTRSTMMKIMIKMGAEGFEPPIALSLGPVNQVL